MFVSFYGKLPDIVPKWLHHLTFPPTMYENSTCSTSSPTFGGVTLLRFIHAYGCEVVPQFVFNFLMNSDVKHSFIHLLIICILPLCSICCLCLLKAVCYYHLNDKSYLYILDTSSLSEICNVIFFFFLCVV